MSTSTNSYDAIEQLIFKEGLKIETLDFHPNLDLMIVLLNTKALLQFSLKSFPRLQKASIKELNDYQLIANGTGIHWGALDEDLSLKGFLQQELKRTVTTGNAAA